MANSMQNTTGNIDITRFSNLLSDAAVEGNINLLHQLVARDPFLLYRSSSTTTTRSLHLACKLGHLRFVSELLHLRPDLSEAVDPSDQSSTALHLACRNGQLEMVRCLISINCNACFIRDGQGRNPVHIATERGYCDILNELIEVSPDVAKDRVGRAINGDTVFHLCVKHNQLEALKLLVEKVGDETMLNAKDMDGNTVLHVAVIRKRLEIIRLLLFDRRINKDILNSSDLTPMDIVHNAQQIRKTQQQPNIHDTNIDEQLKTELKTARALRGVDVAKSKYFGEWIEQERSALMVVASLIATIAFQGCLSPPGGIWQDNFGVTGNDFKGFVESPTPSPHDALHFAGTSVIAYNDRDMFNYFLILNTIGLISSMNGLILLISGLPWKKVTVIVVMVMMWIALASMTGVYCVSAIALTDKTPIQGMINFGDKTIDKHKVLVSNFLTAALVGCILLFAGHLAVWTMKLASNERLTAYVGAVSKLRYYCFSKVGIRRN